MKEFTHDGVKFTDRKRASFDAVILATDSRPRVNTFLKLDSDMINEAGGPLHSGRETSTPGLYFCGYYVSPTGMLHEIGIEASQIAASIAARKCRSSYA